MDALAKGTDASSGPLRRGRRSARLRPASRPRRRDDRVRGRRTALPRPLPRVLGPSAPLREAAGARHAAARRSASDRGTRCCSLPARPTDACRWTGRRSPTAAWPVPDAELARALGGQAGSLRPIRFAVRDAALVRAVDVVCALAADPDADALAQEEALAVLAARVAARCENPRACGKAARERRPRRSRARPVPPRGALRRRGRAFRAGRGGGPVPLSPSCARSRPARASRRTATCKRCARNRARRLIADGLAPSQAAAQSGFSDQAHMTRVFKALFGLTPARYRASVERGRRA